MQDINMNKEALSGIDVKKVSLPSHCEFFITARCRPGETIKGMFEALRRTIEESNAQIVSQDIFGIQNKKGEGAQLLRQAFGDISWPILWIDQEGSLAGTQVWAVSGVDVQPLKLNGQIVGSIYEDNYLRYCKLAGLVPADKECSRETQTRQIFNQMDEALTAVDFKFEHTVRTWFYNDDIRW